MVGENTVEVVQRLRIRLQDPRRYVRYSGVNLSLLPPSPLLYINLNLSCHSPIDEPCAHHTRSAFRLLSAKRKKKKKNEKKREGKVSINPQPFFSLLRMVYIAQLSYPPNLESLNRSLKSQLT